MIEFFNTSASVAKICRQHSISPTAFQSWMGKVPLRKQTHRQKNITKNRSKTMANFRRVIGEITMYGDVLKKSWRKYRLHMRCTSR